MGFVPARSAFICAHRDLPTNGQFSNQRMEKDVGVSLTKGGNISLTKEAPGLTSVTVGLGWDARTTDGQPFDLDASGIGCTVDGKAVSDQHFVFFNNLRSPDGTIEHSGDNL